MAISIRRRHCFIAATLILAIVLPLAILEISLRMFDPFGVKERASWHFLAWEGLRKSANPEKVWEHVPGYQRKLVGYRVAIDSLGLRGGEVSDEKPPDCRRILALGDSMTFGMSADQEDCYPAQLQRMLRVRHPNQRIEVLNAGVLGYTTLQEEALLRELLPKVKPDLVILWWYHNDVVLTGAANPAAQDEQLRVQIGLKPRTFARKLLHGAYEILPCATALIRAATIGRRDANNPQYRADPESQPEGFAANLASLKRIIDFCKANSTALVVYTFGRYEAVQKLCAENLVDNAIQNSWQGREFEHEFAVSKVDAHFNPAGNYLVAESILEVVEQYLEYWKTHGSQKPPSEK